MKILRGILRVSLPACGFWRSGMQSKSISNLGIWMLAAVLGALVVACAIPARAQDEYAGDIVCGGSRKKFLVPMACVKGCSARRTLANFSGGTCGFSSSCPAYGKEDRSALPVFYNQALFGRGVIAGEKAQLVLVSHIINTYYAPNNVKQIHVAIGTSPGGDNWAHLVPGARGQAPTLMVQSDLLLLSPGYLISTIGHEMVHVEQGKRSYKTNQTGINSLVQDMWELEASSWELNADNFSRSIGANKTAGCIQDQEKTSNHNIYVCRQWEVRKALEDIRTGPKSSTYLPSAEKWLNEDPWTSQIWLPANPNWRTQKAGPKPQECGP